MAVIEGGVSGQLVGVGAEAGSAAHMQMKAIDAGALGHYAVSVQTGAIGAGAAANSEIFQLRWSDASRFCVVTKILLTGVRATTAFAAGAIDFKATVARSWTVSGTGGTALTLTGEQAQLRTSFGTSLMGDMRVATTAALGAGTKTLDTQDIGIITTHSSAGWNSATPIIGQIYQPMIELWKPDTDRGEHPLVLAQNEGVVVRATVPATGVWNASVTVQWTETTAY